MDMDMEQGVHTEEEGFPPNEVIHEEAMEEEERKTHGSPNLVEQNTAFRESGPNNFETQNLPSTGHDD